MKVNLHPKRFKIEDFRRLADNLTTVKEVYEDAIATYGDKARSLLDRSGSNPIGAISLLMLAADQRKATAGQAAEPTLIEQALAQTVREQRDTIGQLKGQVNLYRGQVDHYRGQWRAAVDEAVSIHADLCQQEVNAGQIARLQSVLRAVTASDGVFARLYADDLRALPNGTVVRDERGRAGTRIDDEDGGVWATPSEDATMPSTYLTAKSAVYLAWVADQ